MHRSQAASAIVLGLLAAAVPVVHAAPSTPATPLWQVITLPPPDGGGAFSAAEPGIAIAPDGTAIVDAATANTGAPPTYWILHHGRGAWDHGRDVDTTGASTGDADVAAGADGYLYALNLAYNPNPPGQPANPTVMVYRSHDGYAWSGPASFPVPHGLDQPDRPWLIVDPRHPADVDVLNSEGGGNVVIWRSIDHGATFAGPYPVTGGTNSQAGLALGSRPLVDPGDAGRVFMLYVTVTPSGALAAADAGAPLYEFPMTQLWLATSTDAGLSWSNRLVLDTATLAGPQQGATLGHLLVASAIDPRGALYAALSLRDSGATRTDVYLIHSLDHGATWSTPVEVPAPTASNVMPALAVSHDGTAYLSWYGSAAPDFRAATAAWVEMFAETRDPLAAQPHFVVVKVSGATPVHVGGIDTAGTVGSDLGANWGLRDLQSIAVDTSGRPHPVWAVDNGMQATQTAVLVEDRGQRPPTSVSTPRPAGLPNTASAGSPLGLITLLLAAAAGALRRRRRYTNA
jgi:hypothetical protein